MSESLLHYLWNQMFSYVYVHLLKMTILFQSVFSLTFSFCPK